MKKFLLIVAIAAAGYIGLTQHRHASVSHSPLAGIAATGSTDAAFTQALETRASGLQLQGQGTVTKLLPDDNEGSRHQRFVVTLRSGQTLLVAHNIDVAPRIRSLREGDAVSFCGEYAWNPQGGVIHWTHRDPGGHHAAGWLKHGDQKYQ